MKCTRGMQTRNSCERRLSILTRVQRSKSINYGYTLQVKYDFANEREAVGFAKYGKGDEHQDMQTDSL